MTFRVEVTAQAEHDSDLILDWLLSHHAGNAGVRWIEALQDAIKSLGEFPKRCALAPESKIFPFETRQLLYGHKSNVYRILFTIAEETVYVLHIRHGRREPVKH